MGVSARGEVYVLVHGMPRTVTPHPFVTDYDIHTLTALHTVPVGGKTGLGGLRMYRRSA